ncbi:MAG: hypothetical protein HZB66_02070 [Candidatus Aenigmarchaeota archaeon]|nr:hypothetical protein [Candidatus Aenigmarchaeota archaeon]
MAIETPTTVTVPRIEIYGVGGLLGLKRYGPHVLEGQIGTDITDFGLMLKDTISTEITLADQNALFQAYLMHKFCKMLLPDDVRDVVYMLFNKPGRGNKTSDVVDYNKGDTGMQRAKDTDRRVLWVRGVSKFHQDKDGSVKYTMRDDGHEFYKILPAPGYNEWTCDGGWDPETGFAFSTNPGRKAAVRTWTSKGFPEDFAEEIVSCSYTRNEGEGVAGVDRRYFGDDGGRFGVDASWGPEGWRHLVGSFPRVGRRAERGTPQERDATTTPVSCYVDGLKQIEIMVRKLREQGKL